MADIFVSYTSSDRDWAFWIGKELERLSHTPHLHEWEVPGGGDIEAWMEERHDAADHILCVVSEAYLNAPHSSRERRSAQWAIDRSNFALPVFIEDCKARTLFANIKRCDLHGLSEDDASLRLKAFLAPASKPAGPIKFPGTKKAEKNNTQSAISKHVTFPGRANALSNIPIGVPLHFFGRNEDLDTIDRALKRNRGRVAITALHGLRGVGKTTLAAAYADQHRGDYRATWWIRAETESTMRADLVGLGVRLDWVAANEKEELALSAVKERLRNEAEGILLIYDNANSADELRRYLPRGGAAQIIVTSNAPNWRDVATPVEIEVWPREVGADYLIAGTGRDRERDDALALSDALEGLPLAHAQAAAYCDRLGVSLADYRKRFEATPDILLDDQRDAASDYHDGRTVAKTFALAIDEAMKLHPAAEPLIVFAALFAPEPIPLYLFSEGRKEFGEPLASALSGNGLDESVASLRAFALLDRESIPDERDSTISTDCIRLHRLVRQIAAVRHEGDGLANERRKLIGVLTLVYPIETYNNPSTWPRARRLDALALALVADEEILRESEEGQTARLLDMLAQYRQMVLADYHQARPLFERVLAIKERIFGRDHPNTAAGLLNLAGAIEAQGDLESTRPLKERALAIYEKTLGPDHPQTATCLNNLGVLLYWQGDLAGARNYYERALAIDEKALGVDDPKTAADLNNLGQLLQRQGDFAAARPYLERSLAIKEKTFGFNHPDTALSLNNLGSLLDSQGDRVRARSCYERALAIRENVLGVDHLDTGFSLNNLGTFLQNEGDLASAKSCLERALGIFERALGSAHPSSQTVAKNTTSVLDALGLRNEAMALRKKFSIGD